MRSRSPRKASFAGYPCQGWLATAGSLHSASEIYYTGGEEIPPKVFMAVIHGHIGEFDTTIEEWAVYTERRDNYTSRRMTLKLKLKLTRSAELSC